MLYTFIYLFKRMSGSDYAFVKANNSCMHIAFNL